MAALTRNQLTSQLFALGFKPHSTRSRKWSRALFFCIGAKTLIVLIRARGVDLLETYASLKDMTDQEGLLRISTGGKNRFAEYHYTDSQVLIHERIIEVASLFVNDQEIEDAYFGKIGIGRSEWATKYGANSQGSLVSLYQERSIEDGEDVYLSDGMWLTSDGALHDRGR